MAQGLHFQQNVLPSTISPNKPKQLTSPEKRTPTSSDMEFSDALAPNTLVFAPVLT